MAKETTLASIVLILFLPCFDAAACPSGWTSYGTSCYAVVQKSLNWFEAKVACDTLGGGMVEIESNGEDVFLSDILTRNHGSFAWIGLYDFLVERDFVWVSTHEDPEYTHWRAGEPNSQGDEDCVFIRNDGGWNDQPCSYKTWVICEMKQDVSPIG